MIFILINFLFNGFVLGLIYIIGYGFMPSGYLSTIRHLDQWLFGVGYFTTGLLTVLGITNMGQSLLLLFVGGRSPIKREMQKVEPLLNEVIANCNAKIGTNYSLNNLRLMINDSKELNAQSLGRNIIILTDGLLRNSSDDELKGVLAHELGKIHNKYSVILAAIMFGNFATRVCMWIYTIYKVITFACSRAFSKDEPGLAVSLMMMIPLLMFLPIIILNWIGSKILNLSLLFVSRKYGYKADKFAANLGYQAGLISFLQKSQANNEYDNSLIGRVFATHPVPMKRISKLEDDI